MLYIYDSIPELHSVVRLISSWVEEGGGAEAMVGIISFFQV